MADSVTADELSRRLIVMMRHSGFLSKEIEGRTDMENVKKIHELIDQCRILGGKDYSLDIAEYLNENYVIAFPVDIGDTVYYISAATDFGSIMTNGRVFERKVDALQYDGKIKIISYRNGENDRLGNCYEYLGDKVFLTEEEAENRLNEIKGG